MKNSQYNIVTALLGVIIGVLATLIFGSGSQDKEVVKFDGDYNQWRKLNLVLQQIEENYVDTIDMKAMTDAAVTAALQKLDPHSIYLPPVELTEAETELSGNFEGIGITFNVPSDTAIVLSVVPGGPSEKAGLVAGDRIIKVDEKVIAGTKTPQDSMVRYMKGPSGSKVDILVNRDGEQVLFNITRAKIPVHSVDASFMIDDRTGYVKLAKFSRTTYQEVLEAVAKLKEQGMQHLLFDLRSNSGGYFDQALKISNEFLPGGAGVVYMEGLNRRKEQYDADGSGMFQDMAVSILIDESSASSSEIVAGAIQDNDRGVVVGRRSFGKGLVQEPVYFSDGSGLRLTVARFHTPSGRCIQKPYNKGNEYMYDILDRYNNGELVSADSMKVDTSSVYYTVKGRKVYGGGGIIPDIFVPMDTTRATNFYIQCNRKATTMRFASVMFDKYKSRLSAIDDFEMLQKYLESINIEDQFVKYAEDVDKIKASRAEWEESREYMMPQIKGLVGRYSKLGEEAFYRFYLPLDDGIQAALENGAENEQTE
jgi:carboxyl-terminal processing protease